MTSKAKPTDPYAKAGVNIETGNKLVDAIKTSVNATHDRRVLGGIGGFAGLFQLGSKYKNPVLVGCCLLYTSPSPRDGLLSRMPSSA